MRYSTLLPPWALTGRERAMVATVLVLAVLWGVQTERGSRFYSIPKLDLDGYLRAAWAVRTGRDIYHVRDGVGHHYNYPPLPAILLTPLADPPLHSGGPYLPFSVSLAIWYVICLFCTAAAVLVLARAIEDATPALVIRCEFAADRRRWWQLRLVPLLVCGPAIGRSLNNGQMELPILALLCFAWTDVIRIRHFRAGLWVGLACSVKLLPGFLLLYPLWRRNLRMLAGGGAGLVLGFGLIPLAAFGPARTLKYYREYAQVMVLPAVGMGTDRSRVHELLGMYDDDSQSILSTIHNSMNLRVRPVFRPEQATPAARFASQMIGGTLVLLTLAAAGWRRSDSAVSATLFFGALILLMLLINRISHSNYFCLLVPLVLGILAAYWARGSPPSRTAAGVLFFYFLADAAQRIHSIDQHVRDLGIGVLASLLIWLIAIRMLWTINRKNREQAPSGQLIPAQGM